MLCSDITTDMFEQEIVSNTYFFRHFTGFLLKYWTIMDFGYFAEDWSGCTPYRLSQGGACR